jgi:hypothetical protein
MSRCASSRKRKFEEMELTDSKNWKTHYDAYKMLIPDQFCPHRVVFEEALKRKANGEIDQQQLAAMYYKASSEMLNYHSYWPQSNDVWSGAICQMYMGQLIANA